MPARQKLVLIPGLTGEQMITLTMCRALEKPGRVNSWKSRATARLWRKYVHPNDIAWLSAVAVGEIVLTTEEEMDELRYVLDTIHERLLGEVKPAPG